MKGVDKRVENLVGAENLSPIRLDTDDRCHVLARHAENLFRADQRAQVRSQKGLSAQDPLLAE